MLGAKIKEFKALQYFLNMNGINGLTPIAIKNLDDKGRIVIPKKVREEIGAESFLFYHDNDRLIFEAIRKTAHEKDTK